MCRIGVGVRTWDVQGLAAVGEAAPALPRVNTDTLSEGKKAVGRGRGREVCARAWQGRIHGVWEGTNLRVWRGLSAHAATIRRRRAIHNDSREIARCSKGGDLLFTLFFEGGKGGFC